jgi:gp45 sliding clamp, C terminal/DNA polymerase processivity factor
MKLSENTLTILKNFASINQGIVVKKGSSLRTISSNKAILAEATVEETFPNDFGIYDLNKLLSIISLNKDQADATFEKAFISFKSLGDVRIRYNDPSLIITPPNKNINIPSYDAKFELSSEAQNWIFNIAAILKCPNIVVKGENGKVKILAMDVKGEIVDDASVDVDGESEKDFQAVFKIENWKIIPGSYTVELSSVGVARFTSKDKNLTYWIALEQNSSTFNK